jgi:hypothetical protein
LSIFQPRTFEIVVADKTENQTTLKAKADRKSCDGSVVVKYDIVSAWPEKGDTSYLIMKWEPRLM